MRFIITTRNDDDASKADASFDPELFKKYMKFNEDLHQAGVLVASEGLTVGTPWVRLGIANGKRKVLDGPFAESKELVGGFYIIEVASLEEAKAWALKCPTGMGSDDILEIRQLTGADDLPKEILDLAASVAPAWTASFTKKG